MPTTDTTSGIPLGAQVASSGDIPLDAHARFADLDLSNSWTSPSAGMRLGEFLLTTRRGKGTYAEVWEATDTATGASCAVRVFCPAKFLSEDRLEAAERFYKGAVAMERLRDKPRVIQLRTPPRITESGYLWFTMDLHCGDLAEALDANQLSTAEREVIFGDLLEAVAIAHEQSVIHRDIRPKNILLDSHKRAVLADFDIAYYDNQLFNDRSTTNIPGVQRCLPPDLLKVGRNSNPEQLKKLVRRYSNDVYACVVALFDMFISPEGAPIASDRKHFRSEIEKTSRRLSHPVPRRLAHRISVVLETGLLDREDDRYGTIRALKAAWAGFLPETRPQFALSLYLLLAATLLLLLLADYTYYATRLTPTWPVATALLGLAGVTVTGIVSGVINRFRERFSGLRHSIGRFCTRSKTVAILSLLATTGSVAVAALAIGPQKRWTSYRVRGGTGCTFRGDSPEQSIDDDREHIVRGNYDYADCPEDRAPSVKIAGCSFLTPELTVRALAREDSPPHIAIDAGVDALPLDPPLVAKAPINEDAIIQILQSKLSAGRTLDIVRSVQDLWPRTQGAVPNRLLYDMPSSQSTRLNNLFQETIDITTANPIRWNSGAPTYRPFAIVGHIASLLSDCEKSMRYLAASLPGESRYAEIIASDAARCLTTEVGYAHVAAAAEKLDASTPAANAASMSSKEKKRAASAQQNRAEAKETLIATLIWLVEVDDPTLLKAGARERAFRLLDRLNVPWSGQRLRIAHAIAKTNGLLCAEIATARRAMASFGVDELELWESEVKARNDEGFHCLKNGSADN
ncbi:MAG: protein kinase family protein [Kofleriaceae bacterium]|nr:protein kinase family protein [Kofleriaceae bacterium]MCB9572512.1 protein kinase family protein [Kofleriaceae bacterium]